MKPGYFCAAQLHMPPALVNYVSRYNLDEESITFTVTDAATGHTVTVEGLVVVSADMPACGARAHACAVTNAQSHV